MACGVRQIARCGVTLPLPRRMARRRYPRAVLIVCLLCRQGEAFFTPRKTPALHRAVYCGQKPIRQRRWRATRLFFCPFWRFPRPFHTLALPASKNRLQFPFPTLFSRFHPLRRGHTPVARHPHAFPDHETRFRLNGYLHPCLITRRSLLIPTQNRLRFNAVLRFIEQG